MTLIDPELQKYMHQQRLQNWIGSLAQGLVQAATQGRGFGTGLLQGIAGATAGGGDLDLVRTQMQLEQLAASREERKRQRRKEFAAEALMAGPRYDPATDILWNQPPLPGREPRAATAAEARGLLAKADPGFAIKTMFPGPPRPSSPMGRLEVDLRAGLIDKPTYEALKAKELSSSPDLTALQRDVPFIAETLGVSNKTAMEYKMMAAGKARPAFEQDAALRAISQYASPEQAAESARELADIIYGPDPDRPMTTPVATEEKKSLWNRTMEAMGFGGGPVEAGDTIGQIRAMDRDELSIFLRERRDTLTDEEKIAIKERLDDLGL